MRLIFQDARFRLLWLATATNFMGLMIFFTVNGWLTLTLTNSAFWVGATAGVGGLGLMSGSIFGGVLADRLDRRKLIMTSQFAEAAMFFAIATLIFLGQIHLWHILLVSLVDGVLGAVRIPSRMALTLDVVGRANLLRATAANFAAMTSMGISMPPLAGLVVAAFDIAWAYVMMGSALVASATILLALRGIESHKERRGSPFEEFKQALRYVFKTPPVRALIIMSLTSEAFGWAHETMLPVMARDVLGTGLTGLGYLMSAGSAGALVSTLVLSNMRDAKNKGRLLVGGYIGFGLFLMLFATSSWLPLSLVLIAITYAMVMVYETSLSTLLQTTVPDDMRGRVLSFQTFTWGVTGSSGFHAGAIATLLGAPIAIALGGGVLVINGLRLVRSVSRRYQERPELVPGD